MLGATHRLGGIAIGALTPVIIEKVLHIGINDPLLFAGFAMAGGAIGSLIPDIDSPSSTIGRRMKFISRPIAKSLGHRGGTHTFIALVLFSTFITYLGKYLENFLSGNMTKDNIFVFSVIIAIILSSSVLFLIQNIPIKITSFNKKHRTIVVFLTFIITMFIAYNESNTFLQYIRVYLLGVCLGYASHILLDMFTRAGVPFFKPFTKKKISFTKFRTGSSIEEITKVLSTIIAVICIIYLGGIQI